MTVSLQFDTEKVSYPKRRNMTEIRQMVTADYHNKWWFDASTLRVWNSRISDNLYAGRFFVTSEKEDSKPRYYTIRVVEQRTDANGEKYVMVRTVGGFRRFASKSAAHDRAKYYAKLITTAELWDEDYPGYSDNMINAILEGAFDQKSETFRKD